MTARRWSQAVVDALANRALTSKLGAAARQTVAERFDKEVCVQEALRAMGVDRPKRIAAVAA